MKRLVEEVSGEGLESLIGKRVAIWCLNYIYAGKLVGVNDTDILLTDAKIVYETGVLDGDSWKDAAQARSSSGSLRQRVRRAFMRVLSGWCDPQGLEGEIFEELKSDIDSEFI